MAQIEITCPECGNQRAVPDELVGKKIKCKKCQSVFTVKAAPPAGVKSGKPGPAKGDANVNVIPIKQEEDDRNPYVMKEENLAARCPFCAELMDPPDAKICIHCGYNMQQRRRVERKIIYETTAVDYLFWHLPTMACFIAIGMLIGFDVFIVMNTEGWIGSDGVVPAGCFDVWVVVISLFMMFFAGRFIFKRLVFQFHPPEQEKKGVAREDD